MNNSAIIIYTLNTLPKMLNFFITPRIEQTIDINMPEASFRVYIINCPFSRVKSENRKTAKILKKICYSNDIYFIIRKHNKYYTEYDYTEVENGIERGNVEEIKAIKNLSALIKLSDERNENLLKGNIGFISASLGYETINMVSGEAVCIFIYEHSKMDINRKNAIFEKLISDKGISAVFTKDLGRIISECSILFVDGVTDLDEYKTALSGKIIIGENPVEGGFRKVTGVLLWFEELHKTTKDNIYVKYNDELLAVLRHYYKDKNPIGFIKRFPYIYMSSG
ncbi:MAG: hypothetical protein ACM3TR_07740 [Caulobacteraceae bacterium]